MTQISNWVSWFPTKPISSGAEAYHRAVINASWHRDNVSELIGIVDKDIKDRDIVVDFGAGTGGSALFFLRDIKKNFSLWLVDNSESWLAKAYDLLHTNKRTKFFLSRKTKNGYRNLAETVGEKAIDYVLSANTVHLIPDLERTLKGIIASLKPGGIFAFQSGNILRRNRNKNVLMIDDTIGRIHDIAVGIINKEKEFLKYRKNLNKRIIEQRTQRRFVFPKPKPLDYYLQLLKSVGFKKPEVKYSNIKVKYADWLNFLKVKRLQCGILPEVGGIKPTRDEEIDRDRLITISASRLFKNLRSNNPLADRNSFVAEWVYVKALKP